MRFVLVELTVEWMCHKSRYTNYRTVTNDIDIMLIQLYSEVTMTQVANIFIYLCTANAVS